MEQVEFSYAMKIEFSSPVVRHCFSLRCLPFDNEYQTIRELFIEVSPHNVLTETADGFGNRILTDRITEPHSAFSVYVNGMAQIHIADKAEEPLNGIYKYPSQYTRCGERLSALAEKNRAAVKTLPTGEAVELLMREMRKQFTYQSGTTTVQTTAEEALEKGKGVCQDYAHILIALCRKLSIPARYVVGIQEGVGETHAWVEFYDNGIWRGIDPTNDKWVNDRYLTLSHGRDFADCGINRGLFIGGGTQKQTIEARVQVCAPDAKEGM